MATPTPDEQVGSISCLALSLQCPLTSHALLLSHACSARVTCRAFRFEEFRMKGFEVTTGCHSASGDVGLRDTKPFCRRF